MRNKIINKNILLFVALNQRNIIILFTTILLSFFMFSIFVYFPKRKEMIKMKDEYQRIKKDIENIESLTGDKTIDAALASLDAELKELDMKLPSTEERTLKELSGYANRMGIEVSSMGPGSQRKSRFESDIAGCECVEIPVSMDLKCTYRMLGEYLGVLEHNFPTQVLIRRISISKEKPQDKQDPNLRVKLDLDICMLVPEKNIKK